MLAIVTNYCNMQVYIKEIKGAKYTVYYNYSKNYLYPVKYHVYIVKSTYKKLPKFDYKNILFKILGISWNCVFHTL